MKDPEQMSKHELVQTIYKLSGINGELLEALELVLEETGTECYCSENYECGRCKSKQALAKYKELK